MARGDSSGRDKTEERIRLIRNELSRASAVAVQATNNMEKFLNQRNIPMTASLENARGELEKSLMSQTTEASKGLDLAISSISKEASEGLDLAFFPQEEIPKELKDELISLARGVSKELTDTLEPSTEKTKNGFEKLKESAKNTFETMKKGSSSGTSALEKFGKRVVGLAKRVFVFSLIAKSFRKMVQATQEGLKNFASFSSEYNKVMSNFKSSTATLKNSLATAFAPIVQTIVPMLTKLCEWLVIATQRMSAFFSAMKGSTTFAKAKKQVIAYGDAVKESQNKVASFDDLNVLDSDKGGGSGELTGADAFETAEIEGNVLSFAEKMKNIFGGLKESVVNWWSELDFSPLIASFENLKNACVPILEGLGNSLKWVFDNALAPFGTFVIEDALPRFFNTLSSAVKMCRSAFEAIRPSLENIWNNVFVPFGEFIGSTFLAIIDTLKEAFDNLTSLFERDGDSINTIFDGIGIVLQAMESVFEVVFGFLTSAFKGVVEAFTSEGGILETLFTTLGSVFEVFNAVASVVFKALTSAFKWVVGLFTSEGGILQSVFEMLKSVFASVGDVFKVISNAIMEIFGKVTDFINEHSDVINKILLGVKVTFTVLGEGIKSAVKIITTIISELAKSFSKIFSGVIGILKDFIKFFKQLFVGDIKGATKSLVNVVIGLVNLLIDAVEGALNSVIKGINSFSFEVPEWVPLIGGKSFSPNISTLNWGRIPKLATGGITNRPTTALIGENGREAVLPLENNTEWMDALADKIGSQEVVIKFEGSLSQLAKVLNPVLKAEDTRIGRTLVVQ